MNLSTPISLEKKVFFLIEKVNEIFGTINNNKSPNKSE
jgi:hypothetical protein